MFPFPERLVRLWQWCHLYVSGWIFASLFSISRSGWTLFWWRKGNSCHYAVELKLNVGSVWTKICKHYEDRACGELCNTVRLLPPSASLTRLQEFILMIYTTQESTLGNTCMRWTSEAVFPIQELTPPLVRHKEVCQNESIHPQVASSGQVKGSQTTDCVERSHSLALRRMNIELDSCFIFFSCHVLRTQVFTQNQVGANILVTYAKNL